MTAQKAQAAAPKLVGISLSRCVNDIAAGRIDYDQVEMVYARTTFQSAAEIANGIEAYKKDGVWKGHDDIAEQVAHQLFADGKVRQPALLGAEPPNLGVSEHWLDAQTLEPFSTPATRAAAQTLEDTRWNARMQEVLGEQATTYGNKPPVIIR